MSQSKAIYHPASIHYRERTAKKKKTNSPQKDTRRSPPRPQLQLIQLADTNPVPRPDAPPFRRNHHLPSAPPPHPRRRPRSHHVQLLLHKRQNAQRGRKKGQRVNYPVRRQTKPSRPRRRRRGSPPRNEGKPRSSL